ncbi:isochorismatase family protein [Pseudomonas hygromyciniae]|uniref:Isochorismatase family protein n=1 Tax=Pseudomonas hygromyciniae TaxID=2812000 RepID=A0ABX7JVK6_9PSED|nr:isochorismatase family protein [Pseudomonas hygromyciniae]QSB39180.1 isochorismatase family protein [Pseudomonas hygromyciniae]
MAKQALILIDIQNDYFPQGKWPLAGVEAAADKAQQLLQAFRQAGDAVIHVRHEFTSDDAPSSRQVRRRALASQGAERKRRTGGTQAFCKCLSPNQPARSAEQRSITDLVVVGSMSHMCIDAVVRAAADYGYTVTVIHDACATRDLEFNGKTVAAAQVHEACMASLAFAYASVVSADEFLKA